MRFARCLATSLRRRPRPGIPAGVTSRRSHPVRALDMGATSEHSRSQGPFRDRFVLVLKEVLQVFATTTPGYDYDKRSRWAYAFNPMADGDMDKPVYRSEEHTSELQSHYFTS